MKQSREQTNTIKIYTRHMHFYGKNAVGQCRTRLPEDI